MDRQQQELKERREATDYANSEFNRVKRAKLENERAKSRSTHPARDEKAEKQLDRERANRASAAASRAKIVCYARELEKRTDRLELDRNFHSGRADRAIRKLNQLREETRSLKRVLRALWELKDPKTCSYLVDSDALFLLASTAEDDTDPDEHPQPPAPAPAPPPAAPSTALPPAPAPPAPAPAPAPPLRAPAAAPLLPSHAPHGRANGGGFGHAGRHGLSNGGHGLSNGGHGLSNGGHGLRSAHGLNGAHHPPALPGRHLRAAAAPPPARGLPEPRSPGRFGGGAAAAAAAAPPPRLPRPRSPPRFSAGSPALPALPAAPRSFPLPALRAGGAPAAFAPAYGGAPPLPAAAAAPPATSYGGGGGYAAGGGGGGGGGGAYFSPGAVSAPAAAAAVPAGKTHGGAGARASRPALPPSAYLLSRTAPVAGPAPLPRASFGAPLRAVAAPPFAPLRAARDGRARPQ